LYETHIQTMLRRTEFPESHHYLPDAAWARSAFTVMRAGKVIAAPDYRIERTAYPGQDVLLCQSGRGFARSEGWTLEVGANALVWLANETPHAHWPDAADPWTVLWVRLDGPDCAALRRKIFGPAPTIMTVPAAAELEAWFARLFSVLRAHGPDIDLALNHLVAEFLHRIGTGTANVDAARLPAPLRRALIQMREAPERPWPTEQIAAATGLSAAQTRRLFKKHLGVSPRRWLTRERLVLAQRRLLEPGASVGRVAELCGFCDIYHFSREFKRHVGASPRTWRYAEAGRQSRPRGSGAPRVE
jgi:AraC-like DNA-binding protein